MKEMSAESCIFANRLQVNATTTPSLSLPAEAKTATNYVETKTLNQRYRKSIYSTF